MKKPVLEKLDVRMPAEVMERLRLQARLESRSANQQAVAYIRRGLEDWDNIRHQLDRIEAMLSQVMERLDSDGDAKNPAKGGVSEQ